MKFLAVCGFGVGSSMVLKMTLEKVIKDLSIDATVENTDISSAKGCTVDAIFTSKELKSELEKSNNCPVFSIKRYMDKKEVEEVINKYLKYHLGEDNELYNK